MPSNRAVLVPSRGNDPLRTNPEDPGALQVFAFEDGRLANAQVVAPGGGLRFRPRHADFHPSGQWAYVVLESQNLVQTYRVVGDRLSEAPLSAAGTLDPERPARPGQIASAIRAHPNGRHLYVANRGTGVEDFAGRQVSNGGENTIAVFSLDPGTGRPTLVQRVDTRGVHPRVIDVSGDGRWLVAANLRPAQVRRGDRVETVSAGLSLFGVGGDGRLGFHAKHDIDAGADPVFWLGAWR